MSNFTTCLNGGNFRFPNKTLIALLVSGVSLGLTGCLDSGSSDSRNSGNSTGSTDGEGSEVVEDEGEIKDSFEDADEDGNANKKGVYTFTLRGLDFEGFGNNEFGFVDFALGIDDTALWRDQLVMQDDRSNPVDAEPSSMTPLYKAYLETAPNVDQSFRFRGESILLGVSDPEAVGINYSIGLKRNTQEADESSPWHGQWSVANRVSRNTCVDDFEAETGEARDLDVRIVDGEVYIRGTDGPYLWQDELHLLEDDTITVDRKRVRWVPVGESSMLDLVTTLSQPEPMTGTVAGDSFSIEFQQDSRRARSDGDEIEEFCTLDKEMIGERIN